MEIDIKSPKGENGEWKVKISSKDDQGNKQKIKFTGNSTHTNTSDEHHMYADVKGGDPNQHDFSFDHYKTWNSSSNSSNHHVEWKTPSGESDGSWDAKKTYNDNGWEKEFHG